jgi:AcrR family transcriptional regulator
MTTGHPTPLATDQPPPRRRDAVKTRALLLDAARGRFARHGYSATTVREIADDAGVNVALISRYFESKEGLFAACLTAAVDELRRSPGESTLDDVPARIAEQVTGGKTPNEVLLLLLRSSGDERADEIRRTVLRGHSERLAAAAHADPDDCLLLRAQVVLAATTGIAMLRASGLEPLASATQEDLTGPLRDLVNAVLAAHQKSR